MRRTTRKKRKNEGGRIGTCRRMGNRKEGGITKKGRNEFEGTGRYKKEE